MFWGLGKERQVYRGCWVSGLCFMFVCLLQDSACEAQVVNRRGGNPALHLEGQLYDKKGLASSEITTDNTLYPITTPIQTVQSY